MDTGASRQACGNPYNKVAWKKAYDKMIETGVFKVPHNDFLVIIGPSFAQFEDEEDRFSITKALGLGFLF